MISIKELANICGVSVATVSKALNDKSDVGAETKNRIRKIATEMGYFPNASARALRARRSYCIGVSFGATKSVALLDEFFPRVLNAIKVSIEKRGYEMILLNKEVGANAMTYLEHCRYRGVDGVIIAYVHFQDPEILELVNSDLQIITVDHTYEQKSSVCFDYEQGIYDLVRYAYDMGHRKIAYIHGEKSKITQKRLDGFFKAASELKLAIPSDYIQEGFYLNIDCAESLTEQLLCLSDPPTCILYPNDFSALGGYRYAQKNHLSIPKDFSIIGYDGIPISKAVYPELTTLVQDSDAMGEAIAVQIVSQIEAASDITTENIKIKGTLYAGASVGKCIK